MRRSEGSLWEVLGNLLGTFWKEDEMALLKKGTKVLVRSTYRPTMRAEVIEDQDERSPHLVVVRVESDQFSSTSNELLVRVEALTVAETRQCSEFGCMTAVEVPEGAEPVCSECSDKRRLARLNYYESVMACGHQRRYLLEAGDGSGCLRCWNTLSDRS